MPCGIRVKGGDQIIGVGKVGLLWGEVVNSLPCLGGEIL